jgi:hypothetical protein
MSMATVALEGFIGEGYLKDGRELGIGLPLLLNVE